MKTTSIIGVGAVGLAAIFLVASEFKKADSPALAPVIEDVSATKADVRAKRIAREVAATKIPHESWRGQPRAITQADQDNAILWQCLVRHPDVDNKENEKKARICVDISLGGDEDTLNRNVVDMVCDYLKETATGNPAKNAAYKARLVDCYASRNWSNISGKLRAKIDDDVKNIYSIVANISKNYESANKRWERIKAGASGSVKDPRETALKNRLPF